MWEQLRDRLADMEITGCTPRCALLGTSGYYWVLIGAAMYFWVLDTKSNNCHEQKAISNNWNNCDLQIWEFMGILLIIGWILLCTDVWGTFYLVPGTFYLVRGTFYLVRGTWLKSCDLQIWTFVCCHGFVVGMAVKQRGQKQHTGGFVIEALVNMANRPPPATQTTSVRVSSALNLWKALVRVWE